MDKNQKTILALALIIFGILFIALSGYTVISLAVTLTGAVLIILGILDIIHKDVIVGIAKIIIGIFLVVFAWLFASVMLYVLGALLIIFGGYLAYTFIANKAKPKDALSIICEIFLPIICIAIGILLFFNSNIVFTIAGILAIVAGIVMLLQQYVFKKQ